VIDFCFFFFFSFFFRGVVCFSDFGGDDGFGFGFGLGLGLAR